MPQAQASIFGGTVKTKDTVRELLDKLPDDCTLEDVLYHLYVIQAMYQSGPSRSPSCPTEE
jgi:hypothetical protein